MNMIKNFKTESEEILFKIIAICVGGSVLLFLNAAILYLLYIHR